MRFALLLAALAGCYNPTIGQGAPCGPSGECPSGLVCIDGRCVGNGTPIDGASDDAPSDSANVVIDAMPDAAPLGPWGTPNEINSAVGGETDPSITQNRLMMMIMSEDDDDIYVGARANTGSDFTFIKAAALSSTAVEKSPEISPDGTSLYFVSNRDGDFDVYHSTFSGAAFSTPTLVAELSSSSEDSDVGISPDGLTAIVLRNASTNTFVIHTRASTTLPFGMGVTHLELSVTTDVGAPSLTNGGAVVYFHAGGTRDLYVAYRMTNGNYTTPVPVTELNTSGSREAAPFVHQDNRYMVFELSSDIYETSR